MKNFLYIIAGVLMFSFAGCDSDDKWKPGPEDNSGSMKVYFSSENSYKNVFNAGITELDIVVKREITTASASVPVKVVSKADVFSIPATVNFAAGESTSILKVSFPNPEFDEAYFFTIEIDGAEYIDNYSQLDGAYRLTSSVTIENWVVFAEPTFKFTSYFDDFQATILYNANTGQYKIEDYLKSGASLVFTVNENNGIAFVGGYQSSTTNWYFYSASGSAVANRIPCYPVSTDHPDRYITYTYLYIGNTYTYLDTTEKKGRLYHNCYYNDGTTSGWNAITFTW